MAKFEDLTEQKFGKLTVKDRVENNKNGSARWLCECECTNKKVVLARHLKSGKIQSCGCLQKERTSKANKKYNTYNLSGEYGIGYTLNGEEFWFDLEDYDLIKNYCWHKNKRGYIVARSLDNDNKLIRFHRLIMNPPLNTEIDHINHETWNNRKINLRIVTHSQNLMNHIIRTNNTSGESGISWKKDIDKWDVYIQENNNFIRLGYFDDFDEAVEVRKEAELEYFGEYTYNPLNYLN